MHATLAGPLGDAQEASAVLEAFDVEDGHAHVVLLDRPGEAIEDVELRLVADADHVGAADVVVLQIAGDGATQRAGWSSDAINLDILGVADTDAKLQIGRLLFQEIKLGQSALTVGLKNRVLKTTFDDVQLYDGHGKGFLNVDATGKAASIGANIGLDGLSALPFLKDAADLSWLSGKAKLGLQLAATGASQLQLVESLNGRADFNFADGAIVGSSLKQDGVTWNAVDATRVKELMTIVRGSE